MEPFSTASMLAIAGKLATTEVTKAAMAGIKSQLQPDKMALVLKQAIESAQATQPETGGLFFRCQAKTVKEFLEQFFKSTEVVKELQKPLQDNGEPDVAVLVEAFDRSAKQHSEMKNYIPDTLRSWMETFVDSYFEQLQGICFQVAKAQYLKQLAHRVDDVKFVGIAVPGEEVEKQEILAQIFVMPDVRKENSRGWRSEDIDYGCINEAASHFSHQQYQELSNSVEQRNVLEEQKVFAMRDRSAPRIPAQKVINIAQKKAVVLGAPGSGKTMLASYFALMLCGTAQSDPTQIGLEKDDDYLPVVVRIRDWILSPKMGLLDYLRSNAEASLACKELPTGFFEYWLERGRALILLDGLDEVVDEAQRRKVAEQIETFLHRYQDNPAVITSRPAGYRWDFFNLNEFPHYTLESFDDKQVATFIDHWYDSRLKDDKAQAERRKADLQKAFARNERIRLLAKNPLLLTIITLIHRYQAELPRQRCKLYEKAVETLLTSWDSGKEIKLYSQVLLFLKSDDLLYILKKLAYWIHTQGSTGETEGGTLIDKDELIRWLRKEIQTLKKCEAHEAKGEAERFIDFIQRRTGLLNEQGRDRYAFVHKTFQEYLTAEEILEIDESEEDPDIIWRHFQEHLHDQHWREVLLLLVSKLKGKKAQKAIQAVLDKNSDYEKWLHRDLLFAGWCLTEDPSRLMAVAPDFVGGILDRLVWLEVGDSDRIGSKIKGEVEKILHCFGETTVEKVLWEKLQTQGDRIDRFRLIEFQAALGHESDASNILISFIYEKASNMLRMTSVIRKLRHVSPEIINLLLFFMKDKDVSISSIAALSFGRIGNTNPEMINQMLSLSDDKDSSVRRIAVLALGQSKNTSSEVIDRLLSLLDDKDSSVRSQAVFELSKLGSNNPNVVNRLISLLDDKDSDICSNAARALGQLGNASQEVVNRLISLLEDKDSSSVRSPTAIALGKLGNASAEVINHLFSLLNDNDDPIVFEVSSILGELGNASSEVVNRLTSSLDDRDSSARFGSLLALNQLRYPIPEAEDRLLYLLDDQDYNMRHGAILALGQLENVSPEVINRLLSLLTSSSGVARSLSKLAKTIDTICPKLVQLLEQNPNHDGIGNAIDCLWSIVVE